MIQSALCLRVLTAALLGLLLVPIILSGWAHADTIIPVGASPYLIMTGVHWAYVTNYADNTVSVIDPATNMVLTTIPVGQCPSALALDTATSRLYVANAGTQTLMVIDITSPRDAQRALS